jgi:2-polyprenyl-3-methyl-5-hydroxy-6-metoxy-1,4-benzoquinol methylase
VQRFWHQVRIAETIKLLASNSGDTLLDIGCGSAVLCSLLAAQNPGIRITGIDANLKAIEFCRSQYNNPLLNFENGLLDEMSFAAGSFSKVTLLEVIEHTSIEQGKALLRSIFNILEPGGILVVSTPNRKSLWPLIEWLLDKLKLVPKLAGEQHEHIYSGKELEQAAFETGFNIHERKTIHLLAPWLSGLSWKLAENIHRAEQKRRIKTGSLLLYGFQKPAG